MHQLVPTAVPGGGGAAFVEMGRPRLHDGVTLPRVLLTVVSVPHTLGPDRRVTRIKFSVSQEFKPNAIPDC